MTPRELTREQDSAAQELALEHGRALIHPPRTHDPLARALASAGGRVFTITAAGAVLPHEAGSTGASERHERRA